MAKINPIPLTPHDGDRLFENATSKAALRRGWERVAENGGASGGDGMSCLEFGRLARQRLESLSASLRNGGYMPGPLRHVEIPKASGGKRKLTIPSVVDRVAQTSVAQTLSPLFEAEFEDVSYGYRPGRSVKSALLEVKRLRDDGYRWTVDADIEAYFDSVPHDKMMERLLLSVSPGPLTELIALWLDTGSDHGRGLPQGSPLSPLLANLYLDQMDEHLLRRNMRLVRYADDFVVLVKSEKRSNKALAAVREALHPLGLRLHKDKTRIRAFSDSLTFLGTVFMQSFVLRDRGLPFETGVESLLREVAQRDAEEEQLQAAEERTRAAGYHRNIRSLYVHDKKHRLGLLNSSFAVWQSGEEKPLLALHPTRLDRVEVHTDVETSSDALVNALGFGLPVSFVNGYGETVGELRPPLPSRARRHLAQASHSLDEAKRVALARIFVQARLHNSRNLLKRINRHRKLPEINRRAIAMGRHIRLMQKEETVEALRGHEGAGAAHFWKGWAGLLMHGWVMGNRTRPAEDAPNIVLNATASMLERDMRIAVERAGLHPGFGTLHTGNDGRDACVYDLMEVFRAPIAESVSLDLFNTKMLRQEHFQTFDGRPRLTTEGYRAVVKGYEERVATVLTAPLSGTKTTWRGIMQEQADNLADYVEGRAEFQPYRLAY
ncbi:MAG: CRISPR-associated endonuclease Cas1 [Pseudomonadota bacterium]